MGPEQAGCFLLEFTDFISQQLHEIAIDFINISFPVEAKEAKRGLLMLW